MFTLLQNDAPPSSAETKARISGISARGQFSSHDGSAELDSIVKPTPAGFWAEPATINQQLETKKMS